MTGPDSDSSDGALPEAVGEPAPRTMRAVTEQVPPGDAPPDDRPARHPADEGARETDATLRSISRLEESN